MYRDAAILLDEHDRAVGAIQIADGLITTCLTAVKRLEGPDTPSRWRAAHALHDDYPEIWRQLDGARRVLATRGANTLRYDQLRRSVVPVMPIRDDERAIDVAPLEDARRGLEELRLAIPGADWRAIEDRTRGLVGTTLTHRTQRYALAGVLGCFVLAVAAWAAAAIPDPQVDSRAEMRKELAIVVVERRARIDELHAAVGERCERFQVHELMKLLVMEGRFHEARSFADVYEARCGEDAIVRKWANAPIPPSAR
ncbi:MAG: hypothetical protein M3680_21540 [Myxococcota bacterium]|nr:hypothetical protein [Myxococcota bacterium]